MQRSDSMGDTESRSVAARADPGGRFIVGVPDDDAVHPWGHRPHRHPHAQFIGAVMGRATVTVADREYDADPLWGVWIPPQLWHSARFDDGFVPLVHNGGPVHEQAAVAVSIDPRLRHALLSARLAPGGGSAGADAALGEVVRRRGPGRRVACPSTAGPLTLPIVEALEADPADPRSLDDWAVHLHISAISIRRAFRQDVGMSFSEWRTRTRVNAAVALLTEGELVTATARTVGMSHNGLIAAFQRHLGVAPTALQQR